MKPRVSATAKLERIALLVRSGSFMFPPVKKPLDGAAASTGR